MNWLYPFLRHGPEAENARERMKQWGYEDPRRTRQVAYHCAQVLGLLRHYPSNMPFEPFLTFHAGVVLSCIATLLQAGNPSDPGAILHLDQLDPGDGSVTKRQTDWIEHGGNVQWGLSGIPSLSFATARQAILDQTASLLKRQKVWGMARNLMKVVLSLGARSADTETQDAAGSLTLLSVAC